ncbi:hypothetical protein H0A64_07135 [Alcaligenaceae bacterium]|nr:hypothetical protein [Alcaligenaceae bacterium]
MPTLSTLNPTLADLASRMTSDGKIDPMIVEMLTETNEILDDMSFIEANGYTEHKTTVRSGLPTGTWRKLNYGVQPEKSRTVQVKDSLGMLETYAEVDKALADLNDNKATWRLSEDRAFIEGLNQTLATTIFYGDSSLDPEKFMGLAPRYSSLSAENGRNIISGGGTGDDNTSIWLLVWGPNTLHGIYPKGSQAGLSSRDLGEATLLDAAGGQYQGYRTHYKWDNGLTLRDWRYAVRIPNIDVSELAEGGTSPADILKLMVRALHRIPNLRLGRAAFYMNRNVSEALDVQSLAKTTLALKTHELEGKFWNSLRGVPIRTSDAILNTEAKVA